jgi:hypothetical protein
MRLLLIVAMLFVLSACDSDKDCTLWLPQKVGSTTIMVCHNWVDK